MTRKIGVTGFRGVTRNGRGFRAEIYVKNKRINLGTYGTALEAAQAWDKAALSYFGPRSDLNFGASGEEPSQTSSLPDPGASTDILYKI